MVNLLRATTEYVEQEDRMRLTGEAEPGHTVVLWLTQRLLGRLLGHLLEWLARQPVFETAAAPDPQQVRAMQQFAQEAAVAAFQPQAPVAAQPQSSAWLVHSIDAATADEGVSLTFKDGAGAQVVLSLPQEPARQWINIVLSQCQLAGWPVPASAVGLEQAVTLPQPPGQLLH